MASAPSTPHHVVGGAFLIREMSKALVSRVAHFAPIIDRERLRLRAVGQRRQQLGQFGVAMLGNELRALLRRNANLIRVKPLVYLTLGTAWIDAWRPGVDPKR
jgi:hypothetical protein